MNSIQFRFFNRTTNRLMENYVVIFQNLWPENNNGGSNGGSQGSDSTQKHIVAWRVIQKCGSNMYHPFTFPLQMSVSIKDSSGNLTTPIEVNAGMTLNITGDSGNLIVAPDTNAQTPAGELSVTNESGEAVTVIYSVNGIPIAYYENLAAGSPTKGTSISITMPTELSVGLVNAFTTGDKKFEEQYVLTKDNWPQSIASVSTSISSADIYMMGGGTDDDAKPITFHFMNVML